MTRFLTLMIFVTFVSPGRADGPWIEVTSDGAQVAAARALAKEAASAEALRLTTQPASFRFELPSDLRRIAASDPAVVAGLKSLAADATRAVAERLPAARVLARIGEVSGVDSMLDILRKGTDADLVEVLGDLDPWHIAPSLATLRQGAIHEALKALPRAMSDEAKRLKILRYDSWNVEGVEEEIRSLWKPGVSPVLRAALARVLPPAAKTAENLGVLVAALGAPGLDLAATGEIFEEATAFLDSTDPEVRRACATFFEEHFPWDQVARLDYIGTPWMTIFEQLAKRATPEVEKVLEKLLESNLDAYYKKYGRQGLARLLGKRIRPRCPLDGKDSASVQRSLEGLGIGFQGTGDESLLRDLSELAARTKDGSLRGAIARCVWKVGGDTARKLVQELVPSLPPDMKAAYLAWAKGESPVTLVTKLAAQGLGVAPAAEAPAGEPGADGDDPPDVVYAVLERLGILAHFDTETDSVPVDHDGLIRLLADCSGGAFQPEAVHQSVTGGGEGGEPYRYTVQFILGGRLFRFQPEDRGDWYDVSRTMEAVELALASAGIPGRFHAMDTGGQDAAYVFGLAERIMVAAVEHAWPMTIAAGDPEARGKAAEDAVRKILENRK